MDIVINNYAIYKFGVDVGAKTPMEAIGKLSVLQEGYTFEGQEITAKLLFHSSKEDLTLEQCFEMLSDIKVMESLVKAVEKYVSSKVQVNDEVKKKEVVTN